MKHLVVHLVASAAATDGAWVFDELLDNYACARRRRPRPGYDRRSSPACASTVATTRVRTRSIAPFLSLPRRPPVRPRRPDRLRAAQKSCPSRLSVGLSGGGRSSSRPGASRRGGVHSTVRAGHSASTMAVPRPRNCRRLLGFRRVGPEMDAAFDAELTRAKEQLTSKSPTSRSRAALRRTSRNARSLRTS